MRGQGFGERSEIVGRLRRLARGREDRAVVVTQQVEPVIDVPGVAQLAGYAEMGAEERGGELRHHFLGGIRACAEASREITVETGLVSRPMTEFVQRRCIVGFDRFERAGRRQIDEIERRNETGLVAAVLDAGVRRRDERLNGRVPLGLWWKGSFLGGEALDLRDIED